MTAIIRTVTKTTVRTLAAGFVAGIAATFVPGLAASAYRNTIGRARAWWAARADKESSDS
jgi:hypothetical protein